MTGYGPKAPLTNSWDRVVPHVLTRFMKIHEIYCLVYTKHMVSLSRIVVIFLRKGIPMVYILNFFAALTVTKAM